MLEQMSSSVDRLTDVAGKQTHHIENLWEEIGQKQTRIKALVNKVNDQRDKIYETTAFDHMRTMDILARPCATNDFKVRREALAIPMQRLIEGKPGFLINKKCQRLRKSLAGGYHFKRISMGAGQERYRSTPNKNDHTL